eukprot:103623-Pyramimonas_sp.AAC.1
MRKLQQLDGMLPRPPVLTRRRIYARPVVAGLVITRRHVVTGLVAITHPVAAGLADFIRDKLGTSLRVLLPWASQHEPPHNKPFYVNYNVNCAATPSTKLCIFVCGPGSRYFLPIVALRWRLLRPGNRLGMPTATP